MRLKVEEEYCWAITQAAGQIRFQCDGVWISTGFLVCVRIHIYMYIYVYIYIYSWPHVRTVPIVPDLPERNYCVSGRVPVYIFTASTETTACLYIYTSSCLYIYMAYTKEWCGLFLFTFDTAPFFCVCPVYAYIYIYTHTQLSVYMSIYIYTRESSLSGIQTNGEPCSEFTATCVYPSPVRITDTDTIESITKRFSWNSAYRWKPHNVRYPIRRFVIERNT
jgi:hypothetical protein